MSVIYKNGKYYGKEGGGSASFPPGGDAGQALIKNSSEDDDVKWGNPEEGRAKSSAIAPVFDEEATYAEGDRVMYEDELYVFNKAHTGAWDSADADKSDVDSEIPDAMSDSDLADVKAAFTGMNQGAPLRMMNYSTDEQVVGEWIDGKPIYQLTFAGTMVNSNYSKTFDNLDEVVSLLGTFKTTDGYTLGIPRTGGSFSFFTDWYRSGNTIAIQTSTSATYKTGTFVATIQYTKTTD